MTDSLFLQYTCEQPALWRQMLAGREEITRPFVSAFKDYRPDRIICIGSGSSNHASLIAKPILETAWQCEVTCVVPSDFATLSFCKAERPLYFAISQSGISTNTHEIVTALRAAGHPIVCVTEFPDSPVGSAASLSIAIPVGEELVGPKTKGVSLSVMALVLLALSVCGDQAYAEALYGSMEKLCDAAEQLIPKARAWCQSCRDSVIAYSPLYVLGWDYTMGAAKESALKLLETNHIPVFCYPFDEYLHGIQCALNQGTCLLCLLPPDGPDHARMLRLAEFVRSVGGKCLLIGPGEAEDLFSLGEIDSNPMWSLLYLSVLQMMAGVLSDARGIDICVDPYPDFCALLGSKMQ